MPFLPFPSVGRPTYICCVHTWQSSQTGNDHIECQGGMATITSMFMMIRFLEEPKVQTSESCSECIVLPEPTLSLRIYTLQTYFSLFS